MRWPGDCRKVDEKIQGECFRQSAAWFEEKDSYLTASLSRILCPIPRQRDTSFSFPQFQHPLLTWPAVSLETRDCEAEGHLGCDQAGDS